jgi:anti-sigma B factor antagonist
LFEAVPEESMVRRSQLVFQHGERDGCRALAVSGEIDLATAPGLRRELETLIAEAHSPAVLDLSAVTFIDASGLSELVAAKGKVAQTDVQLVLVDPSRPCRRILEITGLDQAFEIVTNRPTGDVR